MAMSAFREIQTTFGPEELAILQAAYNDACREIGIEGGAVDGGDSDGVRSALAIALLAAARHGERDARMLKLQALLAVGVSRTDGDGSP
jgi:hypothetical protein